MTLRANAIFSPPPQKPVISTGAFAHFAKAQWRDLQLRFCFCFVLCLSLATQAHAQGCAQCLDSTHATPPAVQAAYRHAIILLGSAGATLFIAGTLLLRRHR
jgi:hypothetical protein